VGGVGGRKRSHKRLTRAVTLAGRGVSVGVSCARRLSAVMVVLAVDVQAEHSLEGPLEILVAERIQKGVELKR